MLRAWPDRLLQGDKRQPARLLGVVRRKHPHALLGFEPARPTLFQIAQPRRLSLGPYTLVKSERLGYGVVVGGRCVPISSNFRMFSSWVFSAAMSGQSP